MASLYQRYGKWYYKIEIKDDEGNRKQISKGGFKTKAEAKRVANEIEIQIHNGVFVEEKKMKVIEFIVYFLNHYAKNKMNEKTYKNRREIISARIVPGLGQYYLDKIKPLTIQNYYQKLIDEGLSPSYVNTIHRLLNVMFKMAVKWEVIKHNPLQSVEPPKIHKKTVQTWNASEIKTFLKSTKNDQYYLVYAIALYTGMRRGEILNLEWDHVDFIEKKITVMKGKTKASSRVISIPELLVNDLKREKMKQIKIKLSLGNQWNINNFVICTSNGTQLLPRNCVKYFQNAINKCKELKTIRFHDLRHTHATLLLTMGENVKVVSERLGHSKINITLDTYSHVLPDMQAETAKRINDMLS